MAVIAEIDYLSYAATYKDGKHDGRFYIIAQNF